MKYQYTVLIDYFCGLLIFSITLKLASFILPMLEIHFIYITHLHIHFSRVIFRFISFNFISFLHELFFSFSIISHYLTSEVGFLPGPTTYIIIHDYFRMDAEVIGDLLKTIRDAVSTSHQRDDDIALPVFDPDRNDCGATTWCSSIESLASELKWSSIKTAAKAGKALKGSALVWFESWEPSEGRSWENFRADIIDAYPERKNLSQKLTKAVLYTSDSAESYSEYAREKLRLLRNTKIAFIEEQLIELVCGSISDVNIRMASLNNGVTTTSALIALLSTYVKNKKRTLENNGRDSSGSEFSGVKRFRFNSEKKCFLCNQPGHLQSQCIKNKSAQSPAPLMPSQSSQIPKLNDSRIKVCTYCKKGGHTESLCYSKRRAESTASITLVPKKEVNFLEKTN